MGVYSSSQFIGIFIGGSAAGFVYSSFGHQGVFVLNSFLALLWFSTALLMKPNVYQLTLLIHYPKHLDDKKNIQERLKALPGVMEITFSEAEEVIYLRIDKAKYLPGSAEKTLAELP